MTRSLHLPRVVLLGRTNVGKSTLFRRLTQESTVISARPNTTRDTKEGKVTWNGRDFLAIDSGGFDIGAQDDFYGAIQDRLQGEIQRASVLLLVTDKVSLTHKEKEYLRRAKAADTPVIIARSKADKPYQRRGGIKMLMGIPQFPISSVSGGGVGDLLDAIVDLLHKGKAAEHTEPDVTLGFIGRTNVGKSSLCNAVMHQTISIVSPKDHTTRDIVMVMRKYEDKNILIADTIGTRKKTRDHVAKLGKQFTSELIDVCDVVALVISVTDYPIPKQDVRLAFDVLDRGKSLLLILNKADMLDSIHKRHEVEQHVRAALPRLSFVPIIFTSATRKSGVDHILPKVLEAADAQKTLLSDLALDDIARQLHPHITSVRQVGTQPPFFIGQTPYKSVPSHLPDALGKLIRDMFPYIATPIKISVKKKSKKFRV